MMVDDHKLIEIEVKLDLSIELLNAGVLSSSQKPPLVAPRSWVSTGRCAELLGIDRKKLYSLRSSSRLGACGIATLTSVAKQSGLLISGT